MSELPEHAAKEWISGFGVTVPRGATAGEPAEVAAAASGLRPPLVVKAYGDGLAHKSEAGGVRLGLTSAAAAASAADEMRAALADRGVTPAGFLVEEQAEPGVEVIVGAVRDPVFGPVVLAGLGGVWTEALADTALRLCPITPDDAREMLAELRGAALLDGFRGAPPVDREALVEVLLAVGGPGGAAETLGDSLAEFELNPVICGPNGAVAVDAHLTVVPSSHEPPGPVPTARTTPTASTTRTEPEDFGRLFAPRGIAVVGASTKRPNFGNMFLGFYRAAFAGRLVAVHPTATRIDGVPCVPSLAAVAADGDGAVDYALVAVPAARCPEIVRQAAGIPYVQVMSSGFGEMGESALERDLAAAAREAGTRLLGPNCMGVYSPAGGQTFIGGAPGRPGRIAVISQSGGLAGEVIKVGERRGLSFSKVATVGNCADVTPAELLRYLAADPGTSVIGLYIEDPKDGRELLDVLRAVRKPVVALVGGRSRQGRRAAASHTGAMVGDARVWAALGRQTGMALVTSQDDLIGVLDFVDLHGGTPGGPGGPDGVSPAVADAAGVLVAGPSGGAGVLAADAMDAAGLDLPPLPGGVDAALRGLGLGAGSPLANPLEIPIGPRGDPDLVRQAVSTIVAARPYADVIAHVNVQSYFTFGTSADPLLAYAKAIGALRDELRRDRPGVRVTLVTRNAECAPPGVVDAVRATVRAAGVPVYPTMEAAATAVAAGAAAFRACRTRENRTDTRRRRGQA
ncbi:MAG TPA: acetate--CoA ligase family protein [Streptosporangiaceae bacterium]|nr:acetate--CoA ligase family protein [Streptosporangiaceae bacterium]